MRILALETSETAGSVAALEDEQLVAELRLDPALRSAKSLAPTIDQLLKQIGWAPTAIELIAVTSGPGSFTGLRIGVTTAKAFAYAVECQVVGVNTLEVSAAQADNATPASNAAEQTTLGGNPSHAAGRPVWAVIDAQRQQFFVAQFTAGPGGALTCLRPTHLVDAEPWLGGLPAGESISGPGLNRYADKIPAGLLVASREVWQPMASTVGRLGHRAWLAGQRATPLTLLPQYFRRTAAEEQWDQRGARSAELGATKS